MRRVLPESIAVDVLVVGGGGAGLRAAIAARDAGATVLLATKGHLGTSGVTATACSDRMAFHATLPHTEPTGPDNWRAHAEDVYQIGGCVSDWDMACVLARESESAFRFLDELGVPFVRLGGQVDQFLTDGSVFARACYTGPHTATDIHRALLSKLELMDVRLMEDCLVAKIRQDEGGRVIGAIGVECASGRVFDITANAIVLATGGAGETYGTHVFPPGMTGDGWALALRCGASIANAEFVQIGLCSVKTGLACSGSLMRALPMVRDDLGREILLGAFASPMEAYDVLFRKGASWPVSAEHSSRAIDVAASLAIASGRRVFLDYSRNPTGLDLSKMDPSTVAPFSNQTEAWRAGSADTPLERLAAINPQSVSWLKARGIDLRRGDPIEIAPSAQHFQGGVRIRTRGETEVAGVFAAGECAGGQHGANRPGGHALLDSQVFGRIAGQSAAEFALSSRPERRQEPTASKYTWSGTSVGLRPSAPPAATVRARVKLLVDHAAGVIRTEDGLKEALAEVRLANREGCSVDEHGLAFAIETTSMLLVAETLLATASARDESRGPHLRFTDPTASSMLPRDDSRFARMSVARLVDGRITFDLVDPVRPVSPTSTGERGSV